MTETSTLPRTQPTTVSRERKKSWLILAALWLLLLVLASMRPLAVPDEGRYGEVSRWMLVSSDWLTPRLDGIPVVAVRHNLEIVSGQAGFRLTI